MQTRAKILVGMVVLVVLAAVFWIIARPTEPRYQGKRLSYWLGELTLGEVGPPALAISEFERTQRQAVAVEAIQRMGTNALPDLLRRLPRKPKPSWLRTKLEALLEKQSLVQIQLPPLPPDRSWQAVRAFQILGASAESAIPQLAVLLMREETSHEASDCLVAIGPQSVPVLIAALTNRHERVQRLALSTLGEFGRHASPAASLLEDLVRDPTCLHGDEALRVLSEIADPTGERLTLYEDQLNNTNRLFGAAFALGRSGAEALPRLLKTITNQNKHVRTAGFAALQPEIRDMGAGRLNAPSDYSFRRLVCLYNLKALAAASRFYMGQETVAMAATLSANLITTNATAGAMIVDLLAHCRLYGVAGLSKGLTDADAGIRAQARAKLDDLGVEVRQGGIIRGRKTDRGLALVFTGHEYAEGSETILKELAKHDAKGSFFLTGDFLENPELKGVVEKLVEDGHYVGPHSDKHLLYCDWAEPNRLLVTRPEFANDLCANVQKIERFRDKLFPEEFEPWTSYPPPPSTRPPRRPPIAFFLPPYEHYNQQIADWTTEMGMILINFTPGTRSNADYTGEADRNFVSSQVIFDSILKKEREDPHGLNGFLLLLHIGAGPGRQDKFHARFGELLDVLAAKGYQFVRVDELLEPK